MMVTQDCLSYWCCSWVRLDPCIFITIVIWGRWVWHLSWRSWWTSWLRTPTTSGLVSASNKGGLTASMRTLTCAAHPTWLVTSMWMMPSRKPTETQPLRPSEHYWCTATCWRHLLEIRLKVTSYLRCLICALTQIYPYAVQLSNGIVSYIFILSFLP